MEGMDPLRQWPIALPTTAFVLKEGETPEAREAERLTLYGVVRGGGSTGANCGRADLDHQETKQRLLSAHPAVAPPDHQGRLCCRRLGPCPESASVHNAAENVRLLIDNAEQGHHLHVFFSIIPDVLLADRGFKSMMRVGQCALWGAV